MAVVTGKLLEPLKQTTAVTFHLFKVFKLTSCCNF